MNTLTSSRQRGISMVITLLMLLALTVIGIAALNNNSLQVKMTNNTAEANFSFQNADSAVVLGEKWVEAQPNRPGACDAACGTANSVWLPTAVGALTAFDWTGKARKYGSDYDEAGTATVAATRNVSISSATAKAEAAQQPMYFIEQLAEAPGNSKTVGTAPSTTAVYYRITGRGTGNLASSSTVTQSIYVKQY